MKKFQNKYHFEKGQVLPLVVIMFFVIIGMVALILDGGAIMSNRRTAQAAADAGALAGGRLICLDNKTISEIEAVAKDYAVTKNGADDTTTAVYDTTTRLVTVTAYIARESFFAKIFNQQTLSTSAVAKSGCFSPKGKYLMPIAWSCRPPIGPGTETGKGCKMQTLDWDVQLRPIVEKEVNNVTIDSTDYSRGGDEDDSLVASNGLPPSKIYIVMDVLPIKNDPKDDSDYKEVVCREIYEPVPLPHTDKNPIWLKWLDAIDCDLNNDGRMDIEGGGNRGWVDLNNGGGGTSEMVDWIKNGLSFPVATHTWLSGNPGAKTPVFEAIKTYRQGQVVLIPVFNAICNDSNPLQNSACLTSAHSSPWDVKAPVPSGGDIDSADKTPNFHIISYDAFYVSCVHTKKQDNCPGFKWAQSINNVDKKDVIRDNTMSVEGFFVTNYDFPVDVTIPCTLNLGICQASMIE